ncbi:MAG TPA: glutamate-5-semialdehyde dehydrogenase [Chryseosolibacter sp.]|nr:glutamate-5-semialdehyde dehydrogenase [Chryseosolibacter sp.]
MSLQNTFRAVQAASRKLSLVSAQRITDALLELADAAVNDIPAILQANKKDLDRMPESDPRYDRLKLTEQRVRDIAADIRNVATLPSPLGIVLEERKVKSGLDLRKITVPLGVIGVIYEARPNVTFDVFSLCLKSGNACILKGGSDAEYSNRHIFQLIQSVLKNVGLDQNIVALLPPDREATAELLQAVGYVDILIPRGSQKLIDFVRDNAKVPVIETGAGIVHTYFDKTGDINKGADIVFNAKTRRVSVCNALDCLLVHRSRLGDLPALVGRLAEKKVMIFADDLSRDHLQSNYPAELLHAAGPQHYGTEFLDYKMSIRTVDSLADALDHINTYSSRHSEAIVAEDAQTIDEFMMSVDAAAVYANASTAFTDGAQFGLGAEIGISTQKLHARGPMALRELTSYKWLVRGNGTVRQP